MPKFKVYLQQYVEEIAEVEVEAATAEEAAEIGSRMVREGEDLDWSDGSDSIPGAAAHIADAAYTVDDAEGNEVWGREGGTITPREDQP